MSRTSHVSIKQVTRTGTFFLMLMAVAMVGWAQSAARQVGSQGVIKQNIVGNLGALDQQDINSKPEQDAPSVIKVYPNPALDGFYVEIPDDESGTLILTDLKGNVLMEVILKGYQTYVQTSDLEPGFYYGRLKLSVSDPETFKIKVRE